MGFSRADGAEPILPTSVTGASYPRAGRRLRADDVGQALDDAIDLLLVKEFTVRDGIRGALKGREELSLVLRDGVAVILRR